MACKITVLTTSNISCTSLKHISHMICYNVSCCKYNAASLKMVDDMTGRSTLYRMTQLIDIDIDSRKNAAYSILYYLLHQVP